MRVDRPVHRVGYVAFPMSERSPRSAHNSRHGPVVGAVFKPAFDTRAEPSSMFSLLATTVTVQRHVHFVERVAAVGGDMLFKIALALLAMWLLGVVGLYSAGDLVHVLLLVGLMLLLLGFLKARDAAARRAVDQSADRP